MWEGGGNHGMVVSFILSVAAGVVSYYICKWLEEQFKAGKH